MDLGAVALEVTLAAVDGRTEVRLGSLQLPRFQADDAEVVVGVGVLRFELERASEELRGAASIAVPPALHPFIEGLVGCAARDACSWAHGGLLGGCLSLWFV